MHRQMETINKSNFIFSRGDYEYMYKCERSFGLTMFNVLLIVLNKKYKTIHYHLSLQGIFPHITANRENRQRLWVLSRMEFEYHITILDWPHHMPTKTQIAPWQTSVTHPTVKNKCFIVLNIGIQTFKTKQNKGKWVGYMFKQLTWRPFRFYDLKKIYVYWQEYIYIWVNAYHYI